MEINEFTEMKLEYNAILKRYYGGCNYVMEHPETLEKYISQILEFKDRLDEIIGTLARKGKPMTEREILWGFED